MRAHVASMNGSRVSAAKPRVLYIRHYCMSIALSILFEKLLQENERSRDLLVENRVHKLMIGVKGETIKDIRDRFPGMSISFPEPGKKSDIVQLRGPKEEVDKCYKELQDLGKKLVCIQVWFCS